MLFNCQVPENYSTAVRALSRFRRPVPADQMALRRAPTTDTTTPDRPPHRLSPTAAFPVVSPARAGAQRLAPSPESGYVHL